MKSRPRLIGFVALGVIVAFSLLLVPGFGASVLTKVKAKKLFYTKSESDSRFLTPSQGDGRYLTPSGGDSRYLPSSGQIRVNASPMTWQKISAAPGIDVLGQRPTNGGTTFGGSTMALQDVPISIEPTQPTVLVGKPLTFVGVNICYGNDQAPDPTTTLDVVRINLTENATGAGNSSILLTDATDRTDINCRDYLLTTPHVLAPTDDISVELTVDYSANAAFFNAGRATFIYQV